MTARVDITVRVDEPERRDLASRAERDKLSLSDYIRVRLGLRPQGSDGDDGVRADAQDEALSKQLADHERRLGVLEEDNARSRAGAS